MRFNIILLVLFVVIALSSNVFAHETGTAHEETKEVSVTVKVQNFIDTYAIKIGSWKLSFKDIAGPAVTVLIILLGILIFWLGKKVFS